MSYLRDGLDRVIRRTEGSNEVRLRYDGASDSPAWETDGAGTVNRKVTVGPPGMMAEYQGTSLTPTYSYTSGLGDVVNTASSTGATTATYRYDPFGVLISGTTPDPDVSKLKNRYVGRWQRSQDASTGLILMVARPYDPALGRFLAVDPIDGGSANDYDYAIGDPCNNYDLDGRAVPRRRVRNKWECAGGRIAGVIVVKVAFDVSEAGKGIFAKGIIRRNPIAAGAELGVMMAGSAGAGFGGWLIIAKCIYPPSGGVGTSVRYI